MLIRMGIVQGQAYAWNDPPAAEPIWKDGQ